MTPTPYSLLRSKRKTLALQIKAGELIVRAPLKLPKSDIDKFIASKESWIADKLAQSKEKLEQQKAFSLTYGDKLLFRGQELTIEAGRANSKPGIDGNTIYLPPDLNSDKIRDACKRLCRRLAKEHISKRVELISHHMGVTPSAIKITSARTRWGSCSSKKSINFSWLLIMADDDAIDYVIVHELAHITEMNHSKRFWAIVEKVLPDYRLRKARLKELQKRLIAENW
jgi:predicted metal-dependent hydrolase